jgi:hypothetical protein
VASVRGWSLEQQKTNQEDTPRGEDMATVDDGKLQQLIGQMLNDLGGAASVAMVRMGDALGLYKTLHEKGSMTCDELAAAASVHPRYLREWLSQQTASNYLTYDSATQKFTLPPEQAMMFAIEDSPVAMMGAFDGVVAWGEVQPQVQEAFRSGGGVA